MERIFHLNEKGFWRFLNALLLSCIGLFGGGRFLGLKDIGIGHLLAVIAVLTCLFFLNYGSFRGRIFCILAGFICLLGTGAVMGIRSASAFIKSYFWWLLGSSLCQEEWTAGYEVLQVLFLVIACYLLQILMEKSFWIKISTVILLILSLLYSLFAEKALSHVEVVFILCYAAVIFVEWTEENWEKEKGRGLSSYMLWVMPFLILYFLLMILMPVPKTPYRWQFVRNIYEQIRESFMEISQNIARNGREDYDLSLSGFTESGELEGELGRDDREIMYLESSVPLASNVYLTGKVYDTFDGRQWLQNSGDISKERYMDTAQTLYALKQYEERYQQDYLQRARLKINYRYFHTGFLFAPLKTWELEQEGEALAFHELGGTLLFDRAKGYGTEYEVVFYQMNEGQASFYHFLETEQTRQMEPVFDKKILEEILRDLRGVAGEDVLAEDLERQRQMIYDTYLKEVTLSGKVQEAIADITEYAETDVEKLRAIESALSSLKYTRTPGELPESVTDDCEFLDYFLLESRQGFCNYFATAFVLLARAQGLPARYVQGFCIPMKDRKEAMVYSYMAHAWPEVYLDGIGWIPFEPTPGFGESRYTSWELKGNKGGASGEDVLPVRWPPGEEDVGESQSGEILEDKYPDNSDSGAGEILQVFGVVLLSILVIALLLWMFDYLIGRYRYQKMGNDKKLNADIRKILRILGIMGIKREASETLEEFARQTERILEKKDMMRFIVYYEGYLYGNQDITSENVAEVRKKQSELMEILWERNKLDFFRAKIYNL